MLKLYSYSVVFYHNIWSEEEEQEIVQMVVVTGDLPAHSKEMCEEVLKRHIPSRYEGSYDFLYNISEIHPERMTLVLENQGYIVLESMIGKELS